VSYALEFLESALHLQRLDVWLQEETLDEIDRLADTPPTQRRRVGDLIVDFIRQALLLWLRGRPPAAEQHCRALVLW
jgi:hypothetical protein